MKKTVKIILLIVGILVVLAAGVAVWQWDNIQALRMARTISADELARQAAQAAQQRADALQNLPDGITIRELTAEEKQQLQSGELSEEAAIALLIGAAMGDAAATEAPDGESDAPAANDADDESGGESGSSGGSGDGSSGSGDSGGGSGVSDEIAAAQQKLNEDLAQIYVLEASFTGQLDGLVSQCKAEYAALENKTVANKASLAQKYMGLASGLEASCDGQMSALIADIRAQLTILGGDQSVADAIESSYASEKATKKATLLSSI